ncbi:MAG: hypothetical protein JXA21_28135 [Anaerolineae bacterium]|nr:hypothetical protein [Anaerolineae bacterium]
MMEMFPLVTKLYLPPPRPDLVSRTRLIARLDEGLRLGHRLTLISASAGSGKTTLVSAWLTGKSATTTPPVVAWLSLDEDDNDPARFWAYVVAALQTACPPLGHTVLPMLRGSQPPSARSILMPLINEVSALSEPVILVLDDYHLIADRAIHAGVAFLLDHLPQPLHLLIATRADPPLPVARLRARGQLTELGAADLRFTHVETAMFLNGVMGLSLRPEDIAALDARTEGWAAGLNLAALSLQGRQDAHTFVEAFTASHHYILDYLIEEVLSCQPEPVQHFLLQTSILDRLCAPLCDSLTGAQDGMEMLERLRRDNLFTIPLDDERRWYRYHPLFGDLLRTRLKQAAPFDRVSALHRRAARWHEENGLIEQAVKHARAAGDFECIAGIAERAAEAAFLDARLTTLLRWVAALPEETQRVHPRLQIYRAWALFMNGHLKAAQQAFADGRRMLAALPQSPEDDALRRALTRLLDTIEMIAQGFLAAVDDKIEEAIHGCSRARAMALEDGHDLLAAQATEGLALAQYHGGRLRASAQSCRRAIDLAARHDAAQAPLAAAGYVELAGIYIEWNDLETAAALLDKALALCREWGAIQTLGEAHAARSRLLQAGGDIAGAWKALDAAREFSALEGEYSMINFRLSTQQAHLNLRTGAPGEVVRWVEGTKAAFAPGEPGRTLPVAFAGALQTILARAYLIQGRAEAALAALAPLPASAEASGAFLRVIEACALKALALDALGDAAAALAALEQSLALAEPEGYVRLYLNEGAPMAQLLRVAASQGIAPIYVSKLLAGFTSREDERREEAPALSHARAATLPCPLTSRELDVLRLINDGLSNREIAGRLVIALNTVKRHTVSIYGKLDVKSRTQALARARELGLLLAGPA